MSPLLISRNVLPTLFVCIALGACSAFVPRSDQASARDVLATENETEQILAMRAYLQTFPGGAYAEEFERAIASREPAYFEARRGSREGLFEYQEVYPNGRFSDEIEERLIALERVEESRAGEEQSRTGAYEAVRESAAEARRLWGARAIAYWTRVLLSVDRWGEPMSSVVASNDDFNEAFASEPRPECSEKECVKRYSMDFFIPVPGRTQMSARLEIQLRLWLDNTRLVGADILLPRRGFSRWYELENREPVADFDPESRELVVSWATERIAANVARGRPNAEALLSDVLEQVDFEPSVQATWAEELAENRLQVDSSGVETSATSDVSAGEHHELSDGPEGQGDATDELGVAPTTAQLSYGAIDEGLVAVVFWAPDAAEEDAVDGVSLRWVGALAVPEASDSNATLVENSPEPGAETVGESTLNSDSRRDAAE